MTYDRAFPPEEKKLPVRRISVGDRRASGAEAAAAATLYEEQFRAFVADAYAVVGEPDAETSCRRRSLAHGCSSTFTNPSSFFWNFS
jgi:hypothetical protein